MQRLQEEILGAQPDFIIVRAFDFTDRQQATSVHCNNLTMWYILTIALWGTHATQYIYLLF